MNKLTYLIIGSDEYVGNSLVKHLLSVDSSIISLSVNDEVFFTNPTSASIESYVYGRSNVSIEAIVAKCDCIIFCYHSLNVKQNDATNLKDFSIQIDLLQLIIPAILNTIKRFVFISSAGSLYADTSRRKHCVEDVVSPKNIYGAKKSFIENYLLLMSRKGNLNYTILREANIYGPEINGVVNNCLVNMLVRSVINQPVEIVNPRIVFRDYLHIDDFIHLIVKVANATTCGIFNAASGKSISTKRLVKMFQQKKLKLRIYYKIDKLQPKSMMFLNIKQTMKCFNWHPKYSISEGILSCLTNNSGNKA